MGESLTKRRRVLEEALRGVKSFSGGGTLSADRQASGDSTPGIRGCKFCASSRGNTEPPSVIRIYWA